MLLSIELGEKGTYFTEDIKCIFNALTYKRRRVTNEVCDFSASFQDQSKSFNVVSKPGST